MKGYFDSIKKILYVFPQTAAEIPYVDSTAEVIYVQQENYAEWATANSEYTSIMKKYNYNLITVNKLVWVDHLDDDITAPYHTITLGSHAGDYIEVDKETAEAGETVTITPKTGYTTTNVNVATNPLVELTIVEGTWVFTMPDSDITVLSSLDNHTITYPDGYEEMFEGPNVGIDGEEIVITPAEEILPVFDQISLTADHDIYVNKDYANKRWTFTMIDENVQLSASLLEDYRLYLTNTTSASFRIHNDTTGEDINSGDNVVQDNSITVYVTDTETYTFDENDVSGKTKLYPWSATGLSIWRLPDSTGFNMTDHNSTLKIDNLSTCILSKSGAEASHTKLLVDSVEVNSGSFVYPRNYCKLVPDTGYTFNSEAQLGDTVLTATFTGVQTSYDAGEDCYTFYMPNDDVNAEVKEYVSYSITYGGNTGLLDNPPASAYPGDKVVLNPADSGAEFDTTSVTSHDVVINKDTSDNVWYFTMPSTNVTIEVLHTYTTTLANGGDVPNWNILKGMLRITNNPESAGETVTMTYSSTTQATQVAAITWIPSDGTTVINQADPTVPTWTWTMPATDLTLTGYVTPPA